MHLKDILKLLILLASSASCNSEKQNVQSQLKGLWKLDKYESVDSTTGIWTDTKSRLNYSGFIMYDGLGHMSTQIQPPGFYNFSWVNNLDSLKAEEIKSLLQLELKSFYYFANYNLVDNGKIIEHFRISSNNPRELKTTVQRYLEIKGDTLILTALEPIGGQKNSAKMGTPVIYFMRYAQHCIGAMAGLAMRLAVGRQKVRPGLKQQDISPQRQCSAVSGKLRATPNII